MNTEFLSHRTVLGYHGCDESLVHDVLIKGKELLPSEKTYDWLGSGIYFWEHGPERALEWAEERHENPAVIGAVIQLGNCFDLLDRKATRSLRDLYPLYLSSSTVKPRNQKGYPNDKDELKRDLDCAVINYSLNTLKNIGEDYASVRGMFQEAEPAFPGSAIHEKSHIQLAIRDKACILGYFRPII